MKRVNVFCIPVYEFKNPQHNYYKASWLEYVRENSGYINEHNLDFTSPNLHKEPLFKPLEHFIKSSLTSVLKDIGVPFQFGITSMWGTRQVEKGNHDSHVHGNSMFAGVYYLSADSDSSGTVFENFMADVNPFKLQKTNYSSSYNARHEVPFEEGKLLIFPAWLRHHTKPFAGTERAIIGFNMMPIGLSQTCPFDRYNYQDFSETKMYGDDVVKWR